MPTARGTFDVSMEAEPPFLEQDGIKLNRNVVRKEFSNDVTGTSEAQMVAPYTATPGLGRIRRHRALHRLGRRQVGLVRPAA